MCNPGYLTNIATWSNLTFPQFLTNQRWQFGWAAWYSAKLPSRPVQFTVQDPDYREAFWGFPHTSIDANVTTAMVSTLYDRVIYSSVDRLAASASVTSSSSCSQDIPKSTGTALVSTSAVLAVALIAVIMMYWCRSEPAGRKSSYSSIEGKDLDSALIA